MLLRFRRSLRFRYCGPRARILALGALLAGCGYSQEPLFPREFRRIAVPIFENETYFRELEFALTDELVRQIQARPDLRLVPLEEADVVLRGRITSLRLGVLSEDERDRIRESSATTTVEVRVLEAASGRVLRDFEVRDRAEFILARGENLVSAEQESFFDLARRILFGLEEEIVLPKEAPEGGSQPPGEGPRESPEGHA